MGIIGGTRISRQDGSKRGGTSQLMEFSGTPKGKKQEGAKANAEQPQAENQASEQIQQVTWSGPSTARLFFSNPRPRPKALKKGEGEGGPTV